MARTGRLLRALQRIAETPYVQPPFLVVCPTCRVTWTDRQDYMDHVDDCVTRYVERRREG